MRSKEEKRKCKGQESTIGKIIYGFLLFMPLLAIGVTSLVSTFNMSAKEETEITYKYQTNSVVSNNDLIVGNAYYFEINNNHPTLSNSYFEILFYTLDEFNFLSYQPVFSDNTFIVTDLDMPLMVYYGWDECYLYLPTNSNRESIFQFDIYSLDYDFTLKGNCILSSFEVSDEESIYEFFDIASYNPIETVETHNLDTQEIFYRAIDKVQESPLFNWAQNSIIYTTTNATCNALSITTPFIPLLLSYWLIISVIYFLYDIALMLVWIIHRKIHELQESI